MWAIVDKNFLGKSHIRLIVMFFKANESSFFEVVKTACCWHNLSPTTFLIKKKWKTFYLIC